jgi:hypothetical protein
VCRLGELLQREHADAVPVHQTVLAEWVRPDARLPNWPPVGGMTGVDAESK